jgi:predicted O-methyltransferase YrrM
MKNTSVRDLCRDGMMAWGEALLLQDIARDLPRDLPSGPLVINIGAGYGTSAAAILDVRPDVFIWSIDPKPAPREAESLRELGLWDLNRCFRVLAKSQKFEHFPHPVDLCFVDGAHSDDPVRRDIEVWLPKIKIGGYILFHDYGHKLPGLTAIVDDAMANHERVGQARYLVAFRKTK